MLDIYDEALRLTEQLTGEESDSVNVDAFVRIANNHAMMPHSEEDAFADPVAMSLAEAQQARATAVAHARTPHLHARIRRQPAYDSSTLPPPKTCRSSPCPTCSRSC